MSNHPTAGQLVNAPSAPAPAGKTLHVGRWRVDIAARSMTNGSVERRLSPRAVGVLSVLAGAGGEVVDRGTLLDRVWPNVTVSDESVTQAIAELRRAFGDRRNRARVIETIAKGGYRLTVPVLSEVAEEATPFDPDAEAFDLRAYQLCLEARMVLARSGPGSVELSEALTREAATSAPDFALAQAEFAIALVQRHLYRANGVPGLEEALARAEAAVRLRPDLAIGHAALGFTLGAVERWHEAKAAFGRALGRDQRDPDTHYLGARTLFAARDYRGAAALAERAGELGPDDYRALYLAARAAMTFDAARARRSAEVALQRVQKRLARDPDEPRALNALGPLMAQLGLPDAAMAALEAEADRNSPLEFYNAVTLAILGDEAGAIEALENVADRGWRHPAWLQAEPCLDRLAGSRRYRRLTHSLGAA